MVKVSAFDAPPPGVGLETLTLAVPPAAMSVDGTVAVTFAALTNVVTRFAPFHWMWAPLTKLDPFTVKVKDAPPATALAGDSDPAVGTGLSTVNVNAFEAPPPGTGFETVTLSVPAAATSDAGTVAVSLPLFTNVVARAVVFHFTVEPLTKLLPVTVRVNPADPTVTLAGDSPPATGTGLSIVNVKPADVPPLGAGLVTFTCTVPAVPTSAALMDAVSFELLTNVVLRLLPPHSTTAPGTKLLPFTVNVKASLPATALEGESEVATGTGLSMVKVNVPEVPPPGAGVLTDTPAVPGLAMSAAVIDAVSDVALP